MITGLLFTLAQKPPIAANDTKDEGRHFPPSTPKKAKTPYKIARFTRNISLALTMIGAALLSLSAANWSFNPAHGLSIQTSLIRFTLPTGDFS